VERSRPAHPAASPMILFASQQAQVADSVQAAVSQMAEALGSSDATTDVILTGAILVVAWLLRRLVLTVARRRIEDDGTRYFLNKAVGYATAFLCVVAIGTVWFDAFASLGTFLGLLTAGIAIALRDLIADLAGWLFILTQRPFEVGDRIEIAGHQGDVVDVSAFKFSILEIGNWVAADQSTGRVIHIPNAEVFRQPVANATTEFPFIWNEIPVMVTFESDWRRAKKILTTIAQKRAGPIVAQAERALKQSKRRLLIRFTKLTPTVYTDVLDSGVVLTIRYMCPPRRRRSSTEEIWEDVLDTLGARSDIDLAYPTTRTFLNVIEGKPGAREPLPVAWRGDPVADPPKVDPESSEPADVTSRPRTGPALVDDP